MVTSWNTQARKWCILTNLIHTEKAGAAIDRLKNWQLIYEGVYLY